MQSNLGTCTQLLLEYVGQDLVGQVISEETKLLLSDHSIGITHTVSCARSSVMAPTTEASQKPSPSKPTSPNPSSSGFSPSTLELSRLTLDGMGGPILSFEQMGSWLHSPEGRDGSLVAVTIHRHSEKPLHTILKAHWPTS